MTRTYKPCPCCHQWIRVTDLRPIPNAARVVAYPDFPPFVLGTCPTAGCGTCMTFPVRLLDADEACLAGLELVGNGEILAA